MYGGQSAVAPAWLAGHQGAYDPGSAYWVFNLLNNWAQLRYDAMSKDIRAAADARHARALAAQAQAEEAALALPTGAARVAALELWSLATMEELLEGWRALTNTLIGRYHNGWETFYEGTNDEPEDPAVVPLGYDLGWLKSVGYVGWPGDTFTPPATEAAAAPRGAGASAAALLVWSVALVALGAALARSLPAVKAVAIGPAGPPVPPAAKAGGYARIAEPAGLRVELAPSSGAAALGAVPRYQAEVCV